MVQESSASAAHERVDYLDGWRGIAILSLLLGHFVGFFGVASRIGNAGRLGVELFFVLSGLLMGRLLFVKKVEISTFYKRRISRIFPALYAYLLLMAVWLALRGKSLLSVIAVVSRRFQLRASRPIAFVVVLSWLSACAYSHFTDWDYYRIFWRAETRIWAVFAAAGLVCWTNETGRRLVRGWSWIVVCLLGLALQTARVPDLAKYTLGSACLALAVTHLQEAPKVVRRVVALAPIAWFGVLSYSIYLWQQPLKGLREVLGGPLSLGGAVLFGAASFYLLENPLRRYLNARWARPPQPGG